LIHGMGFANSIRFIMAKDQNLGLSLLGFNLGLEAGQIAVVIILLLLAYVFITTLRLNRREWVIFLSAAVFGIALKMALDRFPKNKKHNNEETSAVKHNDAYTFLCHKSTEYTKQCCL
jgi:hypothetical protein